MSEPITAASLIAAMSAPALRLTLVDMQEGEAKGRRVVERLKRVQAWLERADDRIDAGRPVSNKRYVGALDALDRLRATVEVGNVAGPLAFAIKRELVRRGEWP